MPLAKFQINRKGCFGLIFCLAVLLSSGAWAPADTWHQVRVVIDGDTLVLGDGTKVRLSGINTPELGRDGAPDQPLARDAKAFLEQMLFQKKVRLETDHEPFDRYGRMIAYVSTGTSVSINQQMLEKGLATLSLHPPNLKHADAFYRAQTRAQKTGRGIWGHAYYQSRPFVSISHWPKQQWGRFDARVERVETTKHGVRLWCSPKYYVWIPNRYTTWFSNLQAYEGRRLEIHGWPARRGDNWYVLVRHPSQLMLKHVLTSDRHVPTLDRMVLAR